MAKKLHLVSLGCSKNLVDSEIMLNRLKEYKVVDTPQDADVIIVNSCGFINPAKEESLSTIFDLNSVRKKDSLLVMAGCLSERYKKELQQELKEVDIFTGVCDYDKIDEIIEKKESRFSDKTFLLDAQDRVVTNSNYHTYIKLSEGCNQKCSFCAIPSFKGRLKSRSLRSISDEVKKMAGRGYYDFSFISQDSSSYLKDFGINDGLVKLIEEMEECSKIKSARILYLYPTTTSDLLIDTIIKSKVVHNYFDMPIQHINEKMLKIMKRGAGKERILEQLNQMRSAKDSFLRTSFIVGHPQEGDKEFDEMKNFIEEFDFDRINIFAYSDEDGTNAFDMKGKVSQKEIEKRIKILNSIVEKKHQQSLQKELNKEVDIIIDGQSSEGEFFIGAKKALWAYEIDGEILINENESDKKLKIGALYKAKITQVVGDKLLATIIN